MPTPKPPANPFKIDLDDVPARNVRARWSKTTMDRAIYGRKNGNTTLLRGLLDEIRTDPSVIRDRRVSFVWTNGLDPSEQYVMPTIMRCKDCDHTGIAHVVTREVDDFVEEEVIVKNLIDMDDEGIIFTQKKRVSRQGRSEGEIELALIGIICSSCGQMSLEEDLVNFNRNRLVTSKYLVTENVYDNDDKVCLRLAWNFITGRGNRPLFNLITTSIVFNVVSGQTYMLRDFVNGKPSKKKGQRDVSTMTYKPELKTVLMNPTETFQAVADMIQKKKSERMGYEVPPIKIPNVSPLEQRYATNGLLGLLTYYNRMPNLNPLTYKAFIETAGDGSYHTYKGFGHIKPHCDDPLREIMKKMGIPRTKSIRKALMASPRALYLAKMLTRHFKDAGNVSRSVQQLALDLSSHRNGIFTKHDKNMVDEFMRDLVKTYGETNVSLKLSSPDCRLTEFIDTARLYSNIRKKNPNFPVPTAGSIAKLHEEYTHTLNRLQFPQIFFEYEDKDFELDDEVEGYTFSLCRDSDHVRNIGSDMRICVGGYVSNIVAKSCHIVIMKKDGRNITCIELNSSKRQVRQAKFFSNAQPGGPAKKALLEWADKKKLDIQTYDLGQGEDWDKRFDDYGRLLPPPPQEDLILMPIREDAILHPYVIDENNRVAQY